MAGKRSVEENTLTIVSNAGMHPIPEDFVFGELFIASSGNLDFSSVDSVNRELDEIILKIKEKLFEKQWTQIYLLPFGHSILSMNIKMAIFRLLRIETIDIFYFGNGKYGLINRDTRDSLLK